MARHANAAPTRARHSSFRQRDRPAVIAFARANAPGCVRPLCIGLSPIGMKTSTALAQGLGWCVPNAVRLDGALRKATPAFSASRCERFGLLHPPKGNFAADAAREAGRQSPRLRSEEAADVEQREHTQHGKDER